MDALSDVLRVAHLTGGVFLHADFFAPWCMYARVARAHMLGQTLDRTVLARAVAPFDDDEHASMCLQ